MSIKPSQKEFGLSFVVFQRDAGEDFFETLSTLRLALQEFNHFPYEILGVDDFSLEPPDYGRSYKLTSHMLFLEENVGICGAIVKGAEIARYEMLLAVPGTNMYDVVAYRHIVAELKSREREIFILGVRNNLFIERPILKYISSKILLGAYKLVTQNFSLRDIHGLNCFRTDDILKYLPIQGRHGGQMQMLTTILRLNQKFIEVQTPIKHGHKNRKSASKRDSRPTMRGILNAGIGLYRSWKISKRF